MDNKFDFIKNKKLKSFSFKEYGTTYSIPEPMRKFLSKFYIQHNEGKLINS